MIKEAKKRNGECLSDKYINCDTKYEWQCNICNYIWQTTWYSINKEGSWCPNCANVVPKTIEDAHKLARKNNGKFLSDTYLNYSTKYKWQCEFGHIWKATYNSISNGTWCPYCAGVAPATIEEMHKLAEENDGKCLSGKYINAYTKLSWQCSKKHIWEATPSNIQQGSWCPQCASGKSENKFREVIEKYFNEKFPKTRPMWLINPKTNYTFELDGYNENLKIAFEYQGYQHFFTLHNNFFGGEKALTKRQKHDRIKKEMCEKRGIILLCPTYELDESEYEDFIKKEIKKLQ
jgi:hypothetical protein